MTNRLLLLLTETLTEALLSIGTKMALWELRASHR